VKKPKTKSERLFSAAVLLRGFALQDGEYKQGFRFVYEGVLRDLGLEEREVEEYLKEHQAEVDAAMRRREP
jgi:hypothetical protein